jgi:putative oxidoreductase
VELFGYTNATTLAWVVGLAELVFGGFVVLGVLTPFAASGLLAIKINAVLLKAAGGFFIASPAGANAVEFDVVLGLGAAALVFTGPGRIALDRGPWHTRPAWGVLCILIGVAAGLLVFFLLRR